MKEKRVGGRQKKKKKKKREWLFSRTSERSRLDRNQILTGKTSKSARGRDQWPAEETEETEEDENEGERRIDGWKKRKKKRRYQLLAWLCSNGRLHRYTLIRVYQPSPSANRDGNVDKRDVRLVTFLPFYRVSKEVRKKRKKKAICLHILTTKYVNNLN